MTSLHDKLSEIEEGLCCLTPKPGVEMPSCHEFSVCDCTVLMLLKMIRHAVEGLEIIREELSTSGAPQELRDTLAALQQLASGKEE